MRTHNLYFSSGIALCFASVIAIAWSGYNWAYWKWLNATPLSYQSPNLVQDGLYLWSSCFFVSTVTLVLSILLIRESMRRYAQTADGQSGS